MIDKYNPLVPDQSLLNEVKFAARDFASMADDLLRRLKIEYGDVYNDYATTSQGIMLRDLVAWAYAGLTWYLDRTASDCFLETARTREAVERIVEQIAYKMRPAAAATTTLTLTFPQGTSSGFTMKDRWRYSGPGGLSFESYAKFIQPSAIAEGGTVSVAVRQGETRTLTYTADGSKNQTYRLSSIDSDRFLAVGATEVWVDGSLWTENDFLEYTKTGQYEISYLANPPIVRFGDGSAGNIPPVGAEVKIRFLIIDGDQGNVKSNTIQATTDTLVIGGETVTFTLTNTEGASGGRDPEEAEKAKKWAPSSFAARGAAITQPDYNALSSTFVDPAYGAVAKAYALNPRSSYDDLVFNALVENVGNVLDAFNSDVTAMQLALEAGSASLDGGVTALTSALAGLQALRVTLDGWTAEMDAALVSVRDSVTNAESRSASAYDGCRRAGSDLAALRIYIADNLSDGMTKVHILSVMDSVMPIVAVAQSDSDSARTEAAAAKGLIDGSLRPALDNVSDAVSSRGALADGIVDSITASEDIAAAALVMEAQAVSMKGESDEVVDTVSLSMGDMQSRIGELFSDDCLSNFVQVPILSLDTHGNYASPSIGLRHALQKRLDQIKGVTHVVEVVDGKSVLVPAEIEVKLKVLSAYIPAEVSSQITATIVGMLKQRDFDKPLYLSSLYEEVEKSSKGIDHVNIEIVGPLGWTPNVIDGKGNLVPAKNQIITLGSLKVVDMDGREI